MHWFFKIIICSSLELFYEIIALEHEFIPIINLKMTRIMSFYYQYNALVKNCIFVWNNSI